MSTVGDPGAPLQWKKEGAPQSTNKRASGRFSIKNSGTGAPLRPGQAPFEASQGRPLRESIGAHRPLTEEQAVAARVLGKSGTRNTSATGNLRESLGSHRPTATSTRGRPGAKPIATVASTAATPAAEPLHRDIIGVLGEVLRSEQNFAKQQATIKARLDLISDVASQNSKAFNALPSVAQFKSRSGEFGTVKEAVTTLRSVNEAVVRDSAKLQQELNTALEGYQTNPSEALSRLNDVLKGPTFAAYKKSLENYTAQVGRMGSDLNAVFKDALALSPNKNNPQLGNTNELMSNLIPSGYQRFTKFKGFMDVIVKRLPEDHSQRQTLLSTQSMILEYAAEIENELFKEPTSSQTSTPPGEAAPTQQPASTNAPTPIEEIGKNAKDFHNIQLTLQARIGLIHDVAKNQPKQFAALPSVRDFKSASGDFANVHDALRTLKIVNDALIHDSEKLNQELAEALQYRTTDPEAALQKLTEVLQGPTFAAYRTSLKNYAASVGRMGLDLDGVYKDALTLAPNKDDKSLGMTAESMFNLISSGIQRLFRIHLPIDEIIKTLPKDDPLRHKLIDSVNTLSVHFKEIDSELKNPKDPFLKALNELQAELKKPSANEREKMQKINKFISNNLAAMMQMDQRSLAYKLFNIGAPTSSLVFKQLANTKVSMKHQMRIDLIKSASSEVALLDKMRDISAKQPLSNKQLRDSAIAAGKLLAHMTPQSWSQQQVQQDLTMILHSFDLPTQQQIKAHLRVIAFSKDSKALNFPNEQLNALKDALPAQRLA